MKRGAGISTLLWLLPAVLALVLTGCGHINGVPMPFARAQPPAGVTLMDLHDISDLQTTFNQDAGKPRLILLVSPT
jgi:hypothetical protein